jgi:regulator of RNase E activity RraA
VFVSHPKPIRQRARTTEIAEIIDLRQQDASACAADSPDCENPRFARCSSNQNTTKELFMNSTPLLERCRQIATSTWSDALDQFNVQGVVSGLSQRSGRGRFAGLAKTAWEVSGPLRTYPRSEFAVGKLIDALEPGRVLAIGAAGAEISSFGGLAALAAKMHGAAAVIIDGACRDVQELQATELWVASRFVTPTSGKTRIRVESMGAPIPLGGVIVRPNDLIVGDDTGIVVIPGAQLEEIFIKAQAIHEQDLEVERLIREGQRFSAAAAAADYL